MPIVKFKLKLKHKKSWLSTGIKKSCKHKRLLKLLICQTKNSVLNQHYKSYGKLLRKCVQSSKKNDNIRKINTSNNISKTMWYIVKERTNKLTPKRKVNIRLRINDNITEDPVLISNTFNNHFVSVGCQDDGTVRSLNEPEPNGRPVISPPQHSMYLKPVDESEVLDIIKNLKNKQSFGIDEIPPVLVKHCADELVEPLTVLVNQSFTEGNFPDKLKLSLVRPIFKKGEATDTCNYRPIALLSVFSEILESAMTRRLYSYCEKYKILDESQNGFRKNRSTTLAVYKYVQEALNIINTKKYAVGVLLDLSKAYDRVSYKILLRKLYGIGIRGVVYDWFESYLTNRAQFVEIEYYYSQSGMIARAQSDTLPVKMSIPQGSVIGCILFIIYLNDLPKNIDTTSVLFADDLSIIFPCSNEQDLKGRLEKIINDVTSWLGDHNLLVNFSKTKVMQFKPVQKKPLIIDCNINQNKKLECVDNFNLLGITIDTNVNWKSHVQKLSGKLSSSTYALYH